jgi:tripartite-type tricarboxylate transporter receptor subunit TctC
MSPDVAAALARLGAEVRPGSPQDFTDFLAAETQKWLQVVKTANVKVE